MGDAEYRMVGDLVEADPESEVLGGEAPVVSERGHVRGYDQDLVPFPGDGQVVGAEVPGSQPSDHSPGGDGGHQRGHSGYQVG